MTSNNVIVFPKPKRNTPPQTMEELMDGVDAVREAHIHFVTDEILELIIIRSIEEGFPLNDQSYNNIIHLMYDSIVAALYKAANKDHPLHTISEELYSKESDGESEEDKEE